MRGVSLRLKINAAILLAFLAAAAAFGGVLHLYMEDRKAAARNRTRTLLGVLAAHRLENLVPLLASQQAAGPVQEILNRLVRVEGVAEASLFTTAGRLVADAGTVAPGPLTDEGDGTLPTGRVFTVAAEGDRLTATLVEPIRSEDRDLGFLRLRYALKDVSPLAGQVWTIFAVAVVGAYVFLAGVLNLMLHRFVLQPVNTLRQALEAVEAGDLDQRVPVVTADALGRVGTAFNAMAARLRETSRWLGESRAEVEEHRALLTRRVEARTAELAAANAQLVEEIGARSRAEDTLRQALAQRDAVLGNTQIGLATTRDGVCTEINARGAQLLGYRREELFGKNIVVLFDDLTAYEALTRLVEQGLDSCGSTSQECQVLCKDGQAIWLRVHGKSVTPEAPASLVVWAFDDITAEKRRQARLEQAKTVAEEASRAKGAFLAVMSHEIRTPLNAVMGLADALLAGQASPEQLGHLTAIRESAGHLLGVVNDILDFSKIEAGKLVLERLDFDVREVVAEAARTMELAARQKGLAFSVTIDPAAPAALRGDAGRLRQVLLNLLGNAVKFTAAGSVSLTVAPVPEAQTPAARVGLAVSVADTGIGIDPTRSDELFERFNQGPGSIARRFGGTGLGLAISKELIERMGGSITVSSREGAGSVFAFTVFLLPGNADAVVRLTGSTAGGDPAGRSVLRILLVEDNALNAAVTRLHMGRMGHSLTVASSAREAYAALARQRYDAVLMDIEMPEIDGITATRAIRRGGEATAPVLDPGLPIIALTAHAVEDVRQQCLDAGMDGFVTKPVNYRTLQSTLDAIRRESGLPAPGNQADPGSEVFSPEAAREAMGISWTQFGSLARASFEEGTRRLTQTVAAVESGNQAGATLAMHTFKATAAALGAYACRQSALELEAVLRQEDAAQSLLLLDRLQSQWGQVRSALAAWSCPDD